MEATEHAMTSWDGAELFYRAWIPRERTDKTILLFHRGHGARLRTADSRNDSGYRCVSREALRPLRHPVSANETKTVRLGPSEELRKIEAPDSRPGAGCAVRRRPAYLPSNCGQCST